MSFFWPTKLTANAGTLARLGRVLHWIAVIVSVVILGQALFNTIWVPTRWGEYGNPIAGSYEIVAFERIGFFASQSGLLLFFVMALCVALLGRGLRYVLSAE